MRGGGVTFADAHRDERCLPARWHHEGLSDFAFESGGGELRTRNTEFGRHGLVGSDRNTNRLGSRGFTSNSDNELRMFHAGKASWQPSLRFVRDIASRG